MYVTKLELWNDTGFVENSAEYPNLSDTLTNPDFTYTDLHPAKEDLFSYFKIKGVSYETLISVSYARVTYDNLSYPVYMWVDSVACISDTSTKLAAVSCHVDLWRTYLGDASLGYGLITKRIRGTADPIQSCPYRYRLAGEYQELKVNATGTDCYWMIVNINGHYKDSSKITRPLTLITPVDKDGVDTIYVSDGSTGAKECVKMTDFVTGKYDEMLKLSPECINSAFISPYPPLKVTQGTGTQLDPYVIKTTTSSETEWIEETGKLQDFKRAISVDYSYNNISVSWSDGTTTTYHEGSVSNTWESFIAGAVAVEGGLGSQSTSAIASTGTYKVTVSGMPIVKLDNLFPNKTIGKGATLHIASGQWTLKTGCSIVTTKHTSYTEVTSGGTAVTQYNFTWDDTNSTWGDYWLCYAPDALPSYTLKTPSSKTQVVQGVDTYDNTHYFAFSDTNKYQEWVADVSVKTTDTSEAVLLDFDGNPVFSLPWGRGFSQCTVRNVITMTSANIEVRFDGRDSRSDGTCAVIPLPSIDITSNAWSEYAFSGQRDYDIAQRKLAAQQALVSSVTGGLSNAFSTGVMAGLGGMSQSASKKMNDRLAWARNQGFNAKDVALYGNKAQQAKSAAAINKAWSSQMNHVANALNSAMPTVMGTGAASVGMMGASLAGAVVDYAAAQYFNGQLQDTEDTLRSKQSESLILAGSGWDWLYYGRMPGFITLVPDDYSLVNFQNNITYNGITCSEPTADCSAYKDYTGPVQIQNLIVTGDIPVQAKYLIANTYAKGIRMKCVNEKPDYDITASSLITRTSIPAGTYVLYNDTDYRYKINCVVAGGIRDQYIVEAGQNVTVTLVAGDVISTLYYDKMWVANQNTVNVL